MEIFRLVMKFRFLFYVWLGGCLSETLKYSSASEISPLGNGVCGCWFLEILSLMQLELQGRFDTS